MDGNGRWAQRRHLPRIAGHRTGVKTARVIIETCSRLHIPCLTLYAFSLENWRRPQAEVEFLMRLLREYLKRELPTMQKNNIRLLFIGRSEHLPESVQRRYGRRDAPHCQQHRHAADSRSQLRRAAPKWSTPSTPYLKSAPAQTAQPRISRSTSNAISEHLYTAGLPDPDLLIRTSGEMRVSNFLLWQIAYAEIYVTAGALAGFFARPPARSAASITRSANAATAAFGSAARTHRGG